MKTYYKIPILLLSIIMLTNPLATLAASNIDPNHQYAWNTNTGWIKFRPAHGGVTVYSDHLEGWAQKNRLFNKHPTYKVRLIIKKQPTPPQSNIGQAIVIAASGAHQHNTLFPHSDELTRRMYRSLHYRGYTHNDIIYMNP